MADEMIEHTPAKTTTQTKKQTSNKKSNIILVVVSVILIIAALIGGFYWGKESSKKSFTFADLTADWQLYKNDEYGFSFKYPKEWKVEANKDKDGYTVSKGIEGDIIALSVQSKRNIDAKEPQYAIQISVPFGKKHYLVFSTSTDSGAKDIFYNIAATLEFNK